MEGLIFSIAILIMSVVIHEVSHGWAANMQGDKTAELAGRLTLNPVKHLDPVGSFIVPVAAYLMSGFIIGWAKPVPYNPYNLRNQKWGEIMVAVAGPASNILVALIFALMIRFSDLLTILPDSFFALAVSVVLINIILAVFNLVPIPPLDGSKILFSLLPYHLRSIQQVMEQYWMFGIVIFIFFFWQLIMPVVGILFSLFTGINM